MALDPEDDAAVWLCLEVQRLALKRIAVRVGVWKREHWGRMNYLGDMKKRLATAFSEATGQRKSTGGGTTSIHFLHIGKTGGSAVKTALASVRSSRIRFVLHPHSVCLEDIPVGESCFFFVRDPLSRAVSGFYSRKRQGLPRYEYPWSSAERTAFEAFETPSAIGSALSDSDPARRDAAQEALRGIQHVGDSYWKWLKNPDYLCERRPDILFVGSQEHLTRDFARLCELLDIQVELPRDEVAMHRNPAGVDRHLSPEAVRNLKSWYQPDYACLQLLLKWFPHLPPYDGSSRG